MGFLPVTLLLSILSFNAGLLTMAIFAAGARGRG